MFLTVVALYRALNRPLINQAWGYTFEGRATPQINALILAYNDMGPEFGSVDRQNLADDNIRVEVELPTGDVGQFYTSIETLLLGTPSISQGEIPSNFYIVDLDYFSKGQETVKEIKSVELLADFIKLLSAFAEDSSELQGGGRHRLLFVLPPDGRTPQKTVVMPVILEMAALENTLQHLSILKELNRTENDKKLHIEEKRLMMRSAIGDVLGSVETGENLLTHLVKNWSVVLRQYRHNFLAYINNFAFDEVRKKIADSEIEYASKLSGVLGDIAGKLLALPVSLIAIIALEDVKTTSAFAFGCAGLLVVSIIYFLVLYNQNMQVRRLEDSFSLTFSPFFTKLNTYPKALREVLTKRKNGIRRQINTLKFTFFIFYVLSIIPTIGAMYEIYVRYGSRIAEMIGKLSQLLTAIST